MSENRNVNVGGVGFWGLLFMVFLVLKLTSVVSWSWWWICAPLWVPAVVVLAIVAAIVVLGIIVAKAEG